ncbi:MAG: SAM-dependent methyltransferase [Proteobacteria bacterium]|nr:SAM-dependent methyltransferase [Pseudomonadota bacterium]
MNTEEWNPGKLLSLSGNYWATCALHAGVKLDIFTVISDRLLTGQKIAEKLGGDARGVIMLLNALASMSLLIKKNEGYSNTAFSNSFLSKESPQYLGYIIMHHHHLMASWNELDKGVITGKAVRSRASFDNPEVRENFLMGMFNLAMNIAPQIAGKIDLSKKRHLLDLGGGPGTYAIHFCLNNPSLLATIYDQKTTRPFAEKTIAKFGLSERIGFQDGDYVEKDITGTYDVAWLSHILHGEGPEDAQKIIQKAVSALEPQGMILIHEFVLNNDMDGPMFPALFSLNMLLGTEKGQSYSEKQIVEMLAAAGVMEIRRIPVQTPNDSGVIQGIVKG